MNFILTKNTINYNKHISQQHQQQPTSTTGVIEQCIVFLMTSSTSLVVLLGEPEVSEEFGIDSLEGWVLVSTWFFDSVAMCFHALVVSGVVLGLGHLVKGGFIVLWCT